MAEEYQFDQFDDGSSRLVGEQQQVKMNEFLVEYSSQLRTIEEALQETLSDVWNPHTDPIRLSLAPYEQTSIFKLITTGNILFNKVFLVFTSLCKESSQLVKLAREKFFTPLLLFGQESVQGPQEGDAQAQIGTMLPFFHDLSNFVNRVYEVVRNYIHQLTSLYSASEKLYQTSFKNVHFNTVFYMLGELLTCLITLDEIIIQNKNLRTAWDMYKRMTKDIKQDPNRFSTSEEQLLQFDKLLLSLEGQLLDGLIYQNCIEQEFDFPGLLEVKANSTFEKEFFLNIREMYSRMTAKTGDLNEIYQRRHFIGLCALYAFFFRLFKKPSDKKFFKAVWELHKIIPLIHLCGNVVWFSTDFLTRKVAFMVKNTIGVPDVAKFQIQYLSEMQARFAVDVTKYYLQVCTWMVRMESNLENRAEKQSIITTRITLITSGLHLAFEIGDLFKQYLYLHIYLQKSLNPSHIRGLCQCIEMLKAIQFTFHRKSAMIGETSAYMMQHIQFLLQKEFYPIKERLQSNTKYSETKLDILAAANLAMQMLNGAGTPDRRLILHLSMNVLFQIPSLKPEQIDKIRQQVRKLDVICSLDQIVKLGCDCSFFYYWSRYLLPNYFSDIYENPPEVQKISYMFAALSDIIPMFNSISHINPSQMIESYDKEIMELFEQNILRPLCLNIEEDLRLHIHTHLKVSSRDPMKQGVKNLAALVNAPTFRFNNRLFSIKDYVTHYLDTTFYNLTTVALYDWKTYAEMRNLAQEKYNLELTEVHLPGQTLEQGVDVLELMRNIHIFVADYYYNLNTQIFIQRNSDGKFLNTVNISHIANSLRTHGAGIMNTTVNFAYQFLRQKFVVFSQFLYDDHIKSRLYKDSRFFRDNKEKLDSKYPLERAEIFNKEIRKLGLADDGSSYLDAFRTLITEIGNAMGYIRMVRSGGLFYTYNSIKFVPDLQHVVLFEDLVSSEQLAPTTQVAAKNLDNALGGLTKNFAEGTDYFKMLVAAFAPEFRSENNIHLKNFHVIVPPLALNFVNYMLATKDKLGNTRKGQTPSFCFCDDGFAIGVAYILRLLDQNIEFDSLHWFESVRDKFTAENEKLLKLVDREKKGAKRMSKEQQTAQLTLKKNTMYLREFELLEYSFSGARIFFKNE